MKLREFLKTYNLKETSSDTKIEVATKDMEMNNSTQDAPTQQMNAKEMSKNDLKGHDVWLLVDKRFGFGITGKFFVTDIKLRKDGIEVYVDKRQKESGKIFVPSHRSGTEFVLFKGPDSGEPIHIDTYDAFKMFSRGMNEGMTLQEGKMSELSLALPKKWKDPEVVWSGVGKNTAAKYAIVKHDGECFNIFVKRESLTGSYPNDLDWHLTPYNSEKMGTIETYKSLEDAKAQIKNAIK